jgi:hypothetical protein
MSAKGEVIVASMISVRAMALAAGCVFQENRALSSDLCSGARRIGRWRIGGGRQEVEEGLVEQQAGRQEVVGQVSNPKLRQIRGGGADGRWQTHAACSHHTQKIGLDEEKP